ncbi:MAG: transporter substrate-binding domain-containing protein [Pseudobutyrivibrio sp.]|nr:transporter substrate-binding domain-containing protein [Pseudobutyrivibrio sp.]
MKKIISTVLVAAMMTTMLVACGSSEGTDTATKEETTAVEATTTTADDTVSSDITTVTDGKLTMATNAYFPPYEFYEGDAIVGIDAEIAAAIAEKLGLELVIEDMEFDSIITAVSTGKADMGLAGMTVTEERLQNINFSTSYATGVQAVIVKADSGITSLDDLAGKTVGVQLATTGDIYASDDDTFGGVDQYNKGNDAVMALTQGKVDAVIIDNEPAKSYVAMTEGLTILDTEYAVEEYAACIAKENDALLEAVNAALEELQADGTLDLIVAKYIVAE